MRQISQKLSKIWLFIIMLFNFKIYGLLYQKHISIWTWNWCFGKNLKYFTPFSSNETSSDKSGDLSLMKELIKIVWNEIDFLDEKRKLIEPRNTIENFSRIFFELLTRSNWCHALLGNLSLKGFGISSSLFCSINSLIKISNPSKVA